MKIAAKIPNLFILILITSAHFSFTFNIDEEVINKLLTNVAFFSYKCSMTLIELPVNCTKTQKTFPNATEISLGGDTTVNNTEVCCQNVKHLLCVIHAVKNEPICKLKKVSDVVADWKKEMEDKFKKDKCLLNVCKETHDKGKNAFEINKNQSNLCILILTIFVVVYFV